MSKAARKLKKMQGGVAPGAGLADGGSPQASGSGDSFWGDPLFRKWTICLALLLATFFVYSQAHGFDFVSFDDPDYIQSNTHVQAGLTLESVKWAATAGVLGNWTPVTMLSYMFDVELFGLHSGASHLVNVFLHSLAAIALFLALRRATKAVGPSAFVAFVFALHPLHVESVAWIAERKDVLSASFAFLALYAYVRYAEQPSAGRYAGVAVLFCLGLMSKPMLVTFPFVLLLVDVWPLHRTLSIKLVWEKLPLLALSAGASVATYFIQQSSGFVQRFPVGLRVENAFVSYVMYLGQTFWPSGLAYHYPYLSSIPAWVAGTAFVLVALISALCLRVWRTQPYLAVGWLWFVGTLVPVIGIVQVGTQSHADRYMYIPMVGLTICLAWGAQALMEEWAGQRPQIKSTVVTAAVAVCAACMFVARSDAEYWRNSETLNLRAIAVTRENDVAEYNLGAYYIQTQHYAEAIAHCETALRLNPALPRVRENLATAHYDFGSALSKNPERVADAIQQFETALQIQPNYPEAHNNLAMVLANRGDRAAAISHFEAAIRLNADYARPRINLAGLLMSDGNYAAAIPHLEAALRARPDLLDAHRSLAEAFAKTPGRIPDSIKEYEAVLKLNPTDGSAHSKLGELLAGAGRTSEAILHLQAGLRTNPDPMTAKTLDRLMTKQK